MARKREGFMRHSYWGSSRVLPIAGNRRCGSQFSNKPTEKANETTVKTGRPTTDSTLLPLILCSGFVLILCILFVPVLTWILAPPLIMLVLGTQLRQPISINRVGLILAYLVFAVPGACVCQIGSLLLFGPLGTFLQVLINSGLFSGSFSVWSDLTTAFIMFILQAIPQLVFIGDLSRYYKGVTTRRNTVLVGIAGQIPFVVLVALGYVLTPPPVLSVLFPLPFALVIGLAIMWLFPPQVGITRT